MTSLGGVTADVVDGPLTNLINKLNEIQDNPQAMQRISRGLSTGTAIFGGITMLAGAGLIIKNITSMIAALRLAMAGGGALSGGGALANGAWGAGKVVAWGKGIFSGGSAATGVSSALGAGAMTFAIGAAITKAAGFVVDKSLTAGLKLAEKRVEDLAAEEKELQSLYDQTKDETMKREYGLLLEQTQEARKEAMEALKDEQERLLKSYYWMQRDIQRMGPLKGVEKWLANIFMPDLMKMGGTLDAKAREILAGYKFPEMSPEMKLFRERELKDNEEWKKLEEAKRNAWVKENNAIKASDPFGTTQQETAPQQVNKWGPDYANELLRALGQREPNITIQILLDGKVISGAMKSYYNGQPISARQRQQVINAGGAVAI